MTTVDGIFFWFLVLILCVLSLLPYKQLPSMAKNAYRQLVRIYKFHPYLAYITGEDTASKKHHLVLNEGHRGSFLRTKRAIFPRSRRNTW